MNKVCKFCGNKNLTEKKVQYIYKHNSKMFIVNDVPCIECDFCGEQYFEGKVLEQIESAFHDINSKKRPIKFMIEAPVENFASIIT